MKTPFTILLQFYFFIKKKTFFWSTLLFAFLLLSCAETEDNSYYLVIDKDASGLELDAINDLKNSLIEVLDYDIKIVSEIEETPSNSVIFILGTPQSKYIKKLVKEQKIDLSIENPGERGGIWSQTVLDNGGTAIVIGGSNSQGLQYAIYDYIKEVLHIDPLAYWTGKIAEKGKDIDVLNFENKTIAPPQIPILGYFENDVDELANLKGNLLEYDWESYTELINSLVKLRYNAIQLFDMLGRPEFFIRPEYKKLRPNYELRLSYVDSLINYAHTKGMKVQIDLSLGYKIKPLDSDKADCWSDYKQDWIDTWTYYLKETPFGKADIFSLRPRNQVWDWEYKSSCNEDKTEVFNEVYKVLGDLIDKHNPKAKKVLVCYSDAMDMFNHDLTPPKEWLIAWSDDGFGGFKYLPKSTKGYNFGTYMHAGFWLNHTVHDPYPKKIDTIMKQMVHNYQADQYCLVNGQQFRPFLLNIEAFSELSKNIEAFDGDVFYEKWTERYFNDDSAKYAVEAMKQLHDAQFDRGGYVEHLWEIRETVSYLSNAPIERPGKTPIPFSYDAITTDYEHVEERIKMLKNALTIANKGMEFSTGNDNFYHDYIVLPINLYLDLLDFENCLHKMAQYKKSFEENKDIKELELAFNLLDSAKIKLNIIHKRSLDGDKNSKWKNWYNPEKRRPNNGFPSLEMLELIQTNLAKLKNN